MLSGTQSGQENAYDDYGQVQGAGFANADPTKQVKEIMHIAYMILRKRSLGLKRVKLKPPLIWDFLKENHTYVKVSVDLSFVTQEKTGSVIEISRENVKTTVSLDCIE